MRAPIIVASRACASTTLLLVSVLLSPVVARANWGPLPGGFPVSGATGTQDSPVTCGDGTRGIYVAWRDTRSGIAQIYAQHYNSDGVAQWTADGIAVGPGAGAQDQPGVIADGTSGVIFVWRDYRDATANIYAQRLAGSGIPATGWPASGLLVGDNGYDDEYPVLVTDMSGGAIFAWQQRTLDTDTDLYAARVLANGTVAPGWLLGGKIINASAYLQSRPHVVSDGDHGAIVSWDDSRTGGADIYATRITSGGSLAAGWGSWDGLGVCTEASAQSGNTLAPDGGGGAVVAWMDARGGIFAQRLNASGVAQWTANGIRIGQSGGGDQFPIALPGTDGDALVAWNASGASLDVWAQCITSTGVAASGWPALGRAVCADPAQQQSLAAAPDGSGGLFVAWQDDRNGDQDIYAQHVTRDGRNAWPDAGLVVCNYSGTSQVTPAVGRDYAGNAFIAWRDQRAGNSDIDGALATGLSNLTSRAVPPGWTDAVVPRNDATATPSSCTLSPVLDGNTAGTWVSYNLDQLGPNPVPPVHLVLSFDEVPFAPETFTDGITPGFYLRMNNGPHSFPGGRHAIAVRSSDPDIPQSDTGDDLFIGQWIWSPLALSPGVLEREAPPSSELPYFGYPNCDGFSFTNDGDYAWAVAMTAENAADDYDLQLYSDYAGSSSGFSVALTTSGAVGATELIVGHFNTPGTRYPAIVRWLAGAEAPCLIDLSFSTGDRLAIPGFNRWGGQVLAANRLADVYEVQLEAGTEYHFALRDAQAPHRLVFAVFPGTDGGVRARSQAEAWGTYDAASGLSTLDYAALTGGWHPLVVFRDNASEVWDPRTYDLVVSAAPLTDVPQEPATTLTLAGAAPNPAVGSSRIGFSLARTGQVRLSILDVNGRRVRTLVDRTLEAGTHGEPWDLRADDGSPVGAGVYWVRLEAEGRSLTRRMIALR